jgi:putative PEP-CTERM system TPR-repeat lipoprotein
MKLVTIGSMPALVLMLAGCGAFTTPQQHLARAQRAMDSGQWGRAAIELRQVVQKDDHNTQAWLLLTHLSLDVSDAAGAQENLNHAIAAGALGAEPDILQAQIWIASGHPQSLVDAIGKHALPGLTEPDRSVQLARAYSALQQPEQAQAILSKVLAAHPDLSDARLAEANALNREGHPDQALAQLNQLLAKDPHNAAAALGRAQLIERTGSAADAEAAFASALRSMPAGTPLSERGVALVGLTETRLAQNHVQEAAESQAMLAKLAPGATSTQLLGARIKLVRGDVIGGTADLQTLVNRAPAFLQAQILLGEAELQQGNLQQAQAALEQAIQLAPNDVQARELLASVRLKMDQPEQAVNTLTPALSQQAADPQMLSLLDTAETRLGSADSVLQALEHAVQAHPQDRTVRLNLAEAYLNAGRAMQALTLLQGTPDLAGDLRRDQLLVAAIGAVHGSSAAAMQVEQLLHGAPHEVSMLDFAAGFYARTGQLGHAQGLLQQALQINSHHVPTLMALAQVEAASGDAAGAEGSLRNALKLDPASAPLRLALADLLIQRKSLSEAQALLAPIDDAREPAAVQLSLARLELKRGDVKQATATLDRTIAQQPGRADLINEAGTVLLQAKQYAPALTRFTKATELAPDNAVYWVNAGRAQFALHDINAARDAFDKAAQLQPQWLVPVSALVTVDIADRNFQSASGRISQYLMVHPHDPDALALQGDVDWVSGQRAAAQTAYIEAQQRRPTASVAVKLFRGRVAAGQANPEQPLQQWLALAPADRVIRTTLGDYYLSRHQVREAAGQYQAVVDLVPTDVVALNNLAWCKFQLHDPGALALAERAHQLAPAAPGVADTLGWILAHQGKAEQALPLIEQALKSTPDNAEMQYHYAYVLSQQGQQDQARNVLSKLLSGNAQFDSRREAEQLLAKVKS